MSDLRSPGAAPQMADLLREAATKVSTVDRDLASLVPSSGAFAADTAGLPARLGRELHAHWAAALGARAREAADTAERLTGMADAIRAAADDYDLTDAATAHRLERGFR